MKRRNFLAQAAAVVVLPAGSAAASDVGQLLFDAHIHLISLDTTRYPQVVANNPAQGGAPATGSGAAPGAGVQKGRARPIPTVEAVLQWMDKQNVEAIAAVQRRGTYGYDNRYILDSADANPGKIAPVVVVDAARQSSVAQLRDMIAGHGLAGVRLTGAMASDGTYPWLASDQAQQVWQLAGDRGVALDLMTTPPGHSDAALGVIVGLAEKFPKTRVVLDHVGWPQVRGASDFGIDDQYAAISKHRNIFFKFTTINLDMLEEAGVPADQFLARAVGVLGADRILWGSDMGNSPGTYAEMVARARAAAALVSAADRKKLLHDTGKAVFVRGGVRL